MSKASLILGLLESSGQDDVDSIKRIVYNISLDDFSLEDSFSILKKVVQNTMERLNKLKSKKVLNLDSGIKLDDAIVNLRKSISKEYFDKSDLVNSLKNLKIYEIVLDSIKM